MSHIHEHYPRFTEAQVEQFVLKTFGIEINATCLVSDIGQNFLLKKQGTSSYIFKIANPLETFAELEAQNRMMQALQGKTDFLFPSLISTRTGADIAQITSDKGFRFNCRLLGFIAGVFWADANPKPVTGYAQTGTMLAQMDRALQSVKHPALERIWHWDLKNVSLIRPKLTAITDARKRHIADYFLTQFEQEVTPLFPTLPMALIHNDANDYNLLLDADGKRVKGMIDFGDAVYSYRIFELAVALTYAMFDLEDPINETVEMVAAYHAILPLQEQELKTLFYAIGARLALSVTMSAYQRAQRPENAYLSVSEKQAWALFEKMIEINPNYALNTYKSNCNFPENESQQTQRSSLLKTRGEVIGKALSISYSEPLKITRGAFQYLFEEDGRSYLDCVNNVCHVGHCHPKVTAAAIQQFTRLNTNTRYLHNNLVEYAQKLTATLPEPLNVCFFVNSGSEANELALRLAKTYTGQEKVLILDHAYHGNTGGLIDISPYKYNSPGGNGPGSETVKIEMPDPYRGPIKKGTKDIAVHYAQYVAEALTDLKAKGEGAAAFMAESLPGCGGQIVLPDGYLQHVYAHIRKAGAVCIADEVQVGFGRVGEAFWGFELQKVVPDIVTMGKPIGNGHPMAAVVTTKEIADAFNNGMEYFNTFGGNPVSCAVGMAVLDVIEEEQLQQNARDVGRYLLNAFEDLKNRYNVIGDVRGAGLFLGVELVLDRETLEPATTLAKKVIDAMRERGVLISTDGPLNNVLKLKPPIIFTLKNAKKVVTLLNEVLALLVSE